MRTCKRTTAHVGRHLHRVAGRRERSASPGLGNRSPVYRRNGGQTPRSTTRSRWRTVVHVRLYTLARRRRCRRHAWTRPCRRHRRSESDSHGRSRLHVANIALGAPIQKPRMCGNTTRFRLSFDNRRRRRPGAPRRYVLGRFGDGRARQRRLVDDRIEWHDPRRGCVQSPCRSGPHRAFHRRLRCNGYQNQGCRAFARAPAVRPSCLFFVP